MTTTPTILLADEDRQLCRIFEKALAGEGYRAISAHDGDEALETLRTGEIQLALLDLALPRLDGITVLESLRKLPDPAGSTTVLLLTGSRPTPAIKSKAQSLTATAILGKPVTLEKLLARVRQHVKTPTPTATEAAPRFVKQQGAPLVGSFKELPFPQLLHHLHGLRATGVLLLESGKKKKALQLRDGYPTAVKSNLINECLGNLLVRRGKLDNDTLKESLLRVKRGEGLQGEILVAMQVLSEEEIPAALREQAEDKLFDIFGWKNGSFRFEIGGRLRRGTSLGLDRSPADLIVGGVRGALPIERIEKFFARNEQRYLARAESPFYRFQDVELSESEEEALAALEEQPRRLAHWAEADEGVRRTLYGLLVTGLLELRDSAAAASAPKLRAPDEAVEGRHEGVEAVKALDPEAERALRTELAATAERLRRLDPHAALGISQSASEEEIDSAYAELAKRAHPDRFRSASSAVRQLADEVFQLLSKAREVLVDPKRREQYELERNNDKVRAREVEEGKAALEAEMEFQTGEARLRQRDYEGALACFGAAVTRFPEEGEYHALYGWCLYLCHPDNSVMVQEAIEHVRRGVQLAHDREKPYLYLGRLYKVIGRGAAAEKMFTRALEISPDCVEALRELRLINLRRQKRGFFGRLFRR